MNKTLTVSVLLFAVTIGFLSFADAEFELIPCKSHIEENMIGTERKTEVTYNCSLADTPQLIDRFGVIGINGVLQQDLTYQEVMILQDIKKQRIAGIYVQPPIDNSIGITNLDNPICNVEHLDRLTKTDYGCY